MENIINVCLTQRLHLPDEEKEVTNGKGICFTEGKTQGPANHKIAKYTESLTMFELPDGYEHPR